MSGDRTELERRNKALEHWRRQVCKVVPKGWDVAFPEEEGFFSKKLVWKITPHDNETNCEMTFADLERISVALGGTKDINIEQVGGCRGYSEMTPGWSAETVIVCKTEVK